MSEIELSIQVKGDVISFVIRIQAGYEKLSEANLSNEQGREKKWGG